MNNHQATKIVGSKQKSALKREVVLLLAEDDDGHAELITSSLRDAGVLNEIVRFTDGEEALTFFFGNGKTTPQAVADTAYLLLLDIRMPRCDGVTVLKRLKSDPLFRKIPVIMLTTTDDPVEIDRCYLAGCNNYVTKPVKFGELAEKMKKLGLFLTIVELPKL